MQPYEIKALREEDAGRAAEIEAMIFSMPWSEQGFLDSIRSKDTEYLAVWIGTELVAYCGFLQSLDEADITNVAVHPDFRRHGIAYAMLRQLMEKGKLRGVAHYTLEVRVGNTAAILLYEKLGFASVGIRKNFYEKPREDAMIMWTK